MAIESELLSIKSLHFIGGNCSQDIVVLVQLLVNIFFCERVVAAWNWVQMTKY